MAQIILWQHDCPGYIETELIGGVIQVTCFVEEEPPPPTPSRVTNGLVLLYGFKEGTGTTINDVSGVGQPLNLTVESQAAISWISGGGLAVNSPTIISSPGPATKVINAVMTSREITVEAWTKSADPLQDGPARILTISTDFHNRDVQLGQATDLYDVRLRTTQTTEAGRPSISSPAGSLTTQLLHVVYTRDVAGTARIYLEGAVVAEGVIGGDMSNWATDYRLALANEVIGSRPWLGEYHLVAIYNRALTAGEVNQNLKAGPHLP